MKESRQSPGPQGERRDGNPGTGPLNGMSEVKGPAFPVRVPESSLGLLLNTLRYADFRVLWVSTLSNQIGQGMQQVPSGLARFRTDRVRRHGGSGFSPCAPRQNLIVGFRRRVHVRTGLTAGPSCAGPWWAWWCWPPALRWPNTLERLRCGFLMFGGRSSWESFHTFYMSSRMVYVYDPCRQRARDARHSHHFSRPAARRSVWSIVGPAEQFNGGDREQHSRSWDAVYAIGGLALLWLREAGESAPLERESVRENIVNYFTQLRSNRTMLILIVTTGAGRIVWVLPPGDAAGTGQGSPARRALRTGSAHRFPFPWGYLGGAGNGSPRRSAPARANAVGGVVSCSVWARCFCPRPA